MYGLPETRYGSSPADSPEQRRKNHADAIKAELECTLLAADRDFDAMVVPMMCAMDNFCCMGGFY